MSTPEEKLYQLKISNVIIFSFSFPTSFPQNSPTSFPQNRLEVFCVLIQVTFKKIEIKIKSIYLVSSFDRFILY